MCGGRGDLLLLSPVRVVRVLDRGRVGVRHELRQGVDRDGEHDGAVVLRGDGVEGLEVPQLNT